MTLCSLGKTLGPFQEKKLPNARTESQSPTNLLYLHLHDNTPSATIRDIQMHQFQTNTFVSLTEYRRITFVSLSIPVELSSAQFPLAIV